jgi:hypothetical protein
MLLDAHKAPRPKRENARPLWDELWKARTVAEKSDSAILAAPNLATTHGRHGSGNQWMFRRVSLSLAVQSAAAAISYLVIRSRSPKDEESSSGVLARRQRRTVSGT